MAHVLITQEMVVGLNTKLGVLLERLQEALEDARQAIEVILARLEAYVRRCQNTLASATKALAECQNADGVDCSYQQEQVYQALLELAEAENALRNFEDAVRDYDSIEPNGRRIVDRDIPEMIARLRHLSDLLDHLKAVRATLNEFSPATGQASSPPASTVSKNIAHHSTTSSGKIVYLRLSQLPDPEGIESEKDFQKVSLSDMQAGIDRLQRMLPIVASGKGTTSDYWADYDRQLGIDYEHGYQRIYEAFFGESAIKISRGNQKLVIINGRHRIWLAKRMGLSHLPVRID